MKHLLTAYLALITVVSFSVACVWQSRRPCRYLIPDGYIGWVRIDFEVKDAPPLPQEDGYLLIKIPPDGLLLTSSDVEEGMAHDEYYYYSSEARRPIEKALSQTEIDWGGSIGQSTDQTGVRKIWQEFFIGPEQEYKLWGRYAFDRDGKHPIGRKETIRPDLIKD